jgi:hypothetical protein
MKETLQRLFNHMQWADAKVLARCRDAHAEVEVAHLTEAVRLYAHVLGTERVWYLRLQKQDWHPHKIWPTLPLDSCAKLAAENAAAAYSKYLSAGKRPRRRIRTSTRGVNRSPTQRATFHSTSRYTACIIGQIATTLRRVGDRAAGPRLHRVRAGEVGAVPPFPPLACVC